MKDKFLKKMIKKIDIEKPSKDFTENIMKKINQETVVESVESQSILSLKYWVLIAVGLIIVISLLFSYDWSFIKNIFSGIKIETINFPSLIMGSFNYVKSLFSGVEISSISVIVILSVVVLILFDRLLKRSFHINLFMI
ncbi:MAG: hypothetical protein K8R41_05520 [Bacteroidales bacterium]|nr:hypothetical protein [Bacteroidales bacterium]